MSNFAAFSGDMVAAKAAHGGQGGAPMSPVIDQLDKSGVHKLGNPRLIADVGYGLSKEFTKSGAQAGFYPAIPSVAAGQIMSQAGPTVEKAALMEGGGARAPAAQAANKWAEYATSAPRAPIGGK
jgi:hypothetical protein